MAAAAVGGSRISLRLSNEDAKKRMRKGYKQRMNQTSAAR
jgi:hypothetical protein